MGASHQHPFTYLCPVCLSILKYLPPRVHIPCSRLSPWFLGLGIHEALLVKTKAKVAFSTSAFSISCVPHLTQQRSQIFSSLPFAICVLIEVLSVVFDIPGQNQFHLGFCFPNLIPGCLDNIPIFFQCYLPLLPPSACFLLVFCEFCQQLLFLFLL